MQLVYNYVSRRAQFRAKVMPAAFGSVKLHIWDTAGQERVSAFPAYRACNVVLFYFSDECA